MSALAWLFGLGALAIAFPFLFHLIRRTPKGQTEFSSLMFLKPTPPTLTRRSRLENILLLLMRVAAICLIASAFMRPFFRGSDTLSEVNVASRRVAILLDTSASMRRSGLWDQAQQQVEKVLGGLEKGDDVALLAFDNTVKPVVPFDDGSEVTEVDRPALVRDGLKTLEPTWARSDLGRALVQVADSLDVWRDSQRAKDSAAPSKLQIVVISDLQQGSKIESLQSYQWPDHVFVKFRSVIPADYSNATVQLLDAAAEGDEPTLRVRVANSDESNVEQFFVNWASESGDQNSEPLSFYVPAGTSRVLKVPLDEAVAAREFVVSGDREDFDNTFFVVPAQQQELSVVYVGDDDEQDPEKLQYYLRRALIETPSRIVNLRQLAAGEKTVPIDTDKDLPTLVVVASPVAEARHKDIDAYLKSGGTLLVVLTDDAITKNTTAWTGAKAAGDQRDSEKQESRADYLMLAEIDFSSPLFRPFANPRYNDFTKIRFWQHQSVELADSGAEVIARFENDDPAVWVRTNPNGGRVFVFASGWQPGQSQLALSTKFVPLINGLIEIAADVPELTQSLLVGETIDFPAAENENATRAMIRPDGSREIIESTQTRFVGADQPGIYQLASRKIQATELDDPSGAQTETVVDASFAVNVDRAESETAAIPVEQLEMFEVNVGEQPTASSELAQMREMRDRDIEDRQKVWKWLIVAAIVLLIAETWLAGRTTSRMIANETSIQPSNRLSGEMT